MNFEQPDQLEPPMKRKGRTFVVRVGDLAAEDAAEARLKRDCGLDETIDLLVFVRRFGDAAEAGLDLEYQL
jgi:hypothetical protein